MVTFSKEGMRCLLKIVTNDNKCKSQVQALQGFLKKIFGALCYTVDLRMLSLTSP